MGDALLSTSEMGEADRLTIAGGTAGLALMEKAGRSVADVVVRRFPAGSRVLVLCGPGNNGGDGFVAARVLVARGYRVALHLLGARDALKGDAGLAAAAWTGSVEPLSTADPGSADVVVDALFGAGLARKLDGEALAAVQRLNASGVPVVAVDVPSGVDGNSGQARGEAVRASETVTFFRLKPGHLLYPGRGLCGPVRVADIGIRDEVLESIRPRAWRNGPDLWRGALRPPREEGHKYGRGHALVLSGGLEGGGAARLAARAALRVGAGLVTVASPSDALPAHAAALDAVMVRRCDGAPGWADLLAADPRRNAVVLGPAAGVGEETRSRVAAALAAGRHLVIDADALTSFAGEAAALASLVAPAAARGQSVVLTPHDGEFRNLFRGIAEVLDPDSKLERARAAARLTSAVVVLKGPDTVVAAPDGRAAINANGSPFLATAGSGDVLAGLVGGLLAQGLPAFDAACAGVWIHGAAGSALGAGLIAEDLPQAVPGVLRELFDAG
ncbi:NAD(P)H-hydrate dehydratase [Alsobacter sp. R-9]